MFYNAVHILNEGGKIFFSTEIVMDKFLVKIEDNGPGIHEDIHESIFDPFVFCREGGNGLGLYMVKQTINNHGGRIWFETKKGKGTTFYIELPSF